MVLGDAIVDCGEVWRVKGQELLSGGTGSTTRAEDRTRYEQEIITACSSSCNDQANLRHAAEERSGLCCVWGAFSFSFASCDRIVSIYVSVLDWELLRVPHGAAHVVWAGCGGNMVRH